MTKQDLLAYDTEHSVMQKLGNSNWDLTNEQFMNLISIMPEISDEVRIKILEQMPQLAQLCSECLKTAKEITQDVLNKNEKATLDFTNRIDIIRESISNELSRDNLSFEQRKFIYEQLIELAKMYNQMDERNKQFLSDIDERKTKFLGKVIKGIGIALAVVGTVVFLSSKDKDKDKGEDKDEYNNDDDSIFRED